MTRTFPCSVWLVCLCAPTASFVAQPGVLPGSHGRRGAFLPANYNNRQAVRLATSYLDRSRKEEENTIATFQSTILPPVVGVVAPTKGEAPILASGEDLDGLNQNKFLSEMASEMDALLVQNDVALTGLPIVRDTASDRLARLARHANAVAAKYTLECDELRRVGVLPDTMKKLNNDDAVGHKSTTRNSATVTNQLAMLGSSAIVMAVVVTTMDTSQGGGGLPHISDLWTNVDSLPSATTAVFHQIQDMLHNGMTVVRTTLQNANPALWMPTTTTMDATTLQDTVTTTMTQMQQSLQEQTASMQEFVRTNTATIELPKVNTDSILQQVNGMQGPLLSKMNDAQELVRTNTATIELPKVDTDGILQQVNGMQGTLLSKMNDAQELVRTNTATIELPKVDTDIILQQVNGMQGTLLAKMNDAQELVRTKTATIELPKVDTDGLMENVKNVQAFLVSKWNAIQELVRAKAASFQLPQMEMDTDALAGRWNGLEGNVMTKVSEAQELVRSKISNIDLPKVVDTERVRQELGMQGSSSSSILSKMSAMPSMSANNNIPIVESVTASSPQAVYTGSLFGLQIDGLDDAMTNTVQQVVTPRSVRVIVPEYIF